MLDRWAAAIFLRLPRRWRPSPYVGRWLVLLTLVAGGLLVVALLARPTSRLVKSWQARRMTAEALAAVEKRDWKTADAKLRGALTLSPFEPVARVAWARLLGQGPPEEAAKAWDDVCKLRPEAAEYRLEYAIALLRVDKMAEAEAEFARCGEVGQRSARGRLFEGMRWLRLGDRPRGISALRDTIRLAPDDLDTRWFLGGQLLAGSATERLEGGRLLESLRDVPGLQRAAILLLFQHARADGDLERARGLAAELAAGEGSSMADQVRLAEVLADQGETSARSELEKKMLKEAEGAWPAMAAVLAWLGSRPETRQKALDVAELLLPEGRFSRFLTPVLAELWEPEKRHLEQFREILRQGDWGEWEMLGAVFRARLAEKEGAEAVRQEQWRRALESAGWQPASLERLLGLSRRWRWLAAEIELYERLAVLRPGDRALLKGWRLVGVTTRRSDIVQRACAALLAAGDESFETKNDFAAAALMRRIEVDRAAKLAVENYSAQPKSPYAAATYAFSLRLQGQAEEGLRVLGQLPVEPGEHPSVQLERACCLEALGRREEARAIATKLPSGLWFPEEEKTLVRLRAGS